MNLSDIERSAKHVIRQNSLQPDNGVTYSMTIDPHDALALVAVAKAALTWVSTDSGNEAADIALANTIRARLT